MTGYIDEKKSEEKRGASRTRGLGARPDKRCPGDDDLGRASPRCAARAAGTEHGKLLEPKHATLQRRPGRQNVLIRRRRATMHSTARRSTRRLRGRKDGRTPGLARKCVELSDPAPQSQRAPMRTSWLRRLALTLAQALPLHWRWQAAVPCASWPKRSEPARPPARGSSGLSGLSGRMAWLAGCDCGCAGAPALQALRQRDEGRRRHAPCGREGGELRCWPLAAWSRSMLLRALWLCSSPLLHHRTATPATAATHLTTAARHCPPERPLCLGFQAAVAAAVCMLSTPFILPVQQRR